MRILITGGAGFIGTNLTAKLLADGHRVASMDNFITGIPKNLTRFGGISAFDFIRHDITRPLPRAITHITFDEIYHLACPTGIPNLTRLAREMLLTCALGTKHIAELAIKTKARMLLTSSSESYGNPMVFPQTEQYTGNVNPIGPRSPYEEGKRFAESLISAYARLYGLTGRIVRVFNTYGPYMSAKDTRVIPAFVRSALSGAPIEIHGKGTQTRTFCFVDDLVSGLITVMRNGNNGSVYNIGGTREVSILALATRIKQLTKSTSRFTFTLRPSHDHARRKPSVRAVRALGWQQHTPLSLGLAKTIAYYRQ